MWSVSQRSQPGGVEWFRVNSETASGSRLIFPWLSQGQLAHLIERWLLVLWLPLEEYEEELWAE